MTAKIRAYTTRAHTLTSGQNLNVRQRLHAAFEEQWITDLSLGSFQLFQEVDDI
jgi:hypothetical protein